jgi:hypothetical protein
MMPPLDRDFDTASGQQLCRPAPNVPSPKKRAYGGDRATPVWQWPRHVQERRTSLRLSLLLIRNASVIQQLPAGLRLQQERIGG